MQIQRCLLQWMQRQIRPFDERPFTIPHKLYFGMSSRKWEDGGVAFLDPEKDDSIMTLGKIYKITCDQFKDIQKQEGDSWYDKILCLGEVDGIPVKTFTHSYVVDEKTVRQVYQCYHVRAERNVSRNA